MDLYPDIAVDLGVFRPNTVLTKLVSSLANYSRRRSDGVISLGDDMKDRLLAHGLPSEKIHVVHNWADHSEIQPKPFAALPLTIQYSGNLGLAHDTSTIQQAMLRLATNENIRFLFIGGGPHKPSMQEFCQRNRLRQVAFHPYCSRDNLSNSLAEGHLGLVSQKPETVGSIVPSKVYGIMAAGRPILYIGPRRATPAQIIERFNCGWQIEVGDHQGVVRLLKRLTTRPDEISCAGERARRAFLENFDRRIGVSLIASILGAKKTHAVAVA
jgi:glycosyltransferase involved in cell wall biosynthesis